MLGHVWESLEWQDLQVHASRDIAVTHLRDLLEDSERAKLLQVEFEGITFDFTHQRMTNETLEKLLLLAESVGLEDKLKCLYNGKKINETEKRAVLHMALRASADKTIEFEGKNVVDDVHDVLKKIKEFTDSIRSGEERDFQGVTGKTLKNVVSIGIGGSYLGGEFVFEALKYDRSCYGASEGRTLRFLANVCPIDVARALEGLDPEETLVVIISKTFTTAETMLNAQTLRSWLVKALAKDGVSEDDVVAKHMCAVSTNSGGTAEFGIKKERVFGFWDWVGGRYSVCSAVGVLPLSLQYGFEAMDAFLRGAEEMDQHLLTAPIRENMPALLGLLGVWNSSFLGYGCRALLPYSQALLRFPAHIQQVDMESNGKRVTVDGTEVPFDCGEIDFGEPGTNGQHSFYQLIHQGRVVPCDFLGFCETQNPIAFSGHPVTNHQELMSNFFAQADALAKGRSFDDLKTAGVEEELWPHKMFPGNRPSSWLLLPRLDPRFCGMLLSLYEHRTAVQGFVWGIPSFDQWGVELGKALAKDIRQKMVEGVDTGSPVPPSTAALLEKFLGSS